MGLDMFLYKFTLIPEDVAKTFEGKHASYLEEHGYHVWNPEYGREEEYIEVKDFMVKAKLICKVFDTDRFETKYDVKGWWRTFYSLQNDQILLGYRSSDDKEFKEISLTGDEYNSYFVDKLEERYVVDYKEVDYWRKEYDLQELIHENHNGLILNCGYALLSDDEVDAIQDYCNESYPWLEEDENYVYMEWY